MARAKPGEMNWAGLTGALDFIFESWLKNIGLDIKKVPYRNPVEAANDLAASRVQVYESAYAIARPQIQAGKIKLLAVTNTTRAPVYPDIPTVAEAGFPALTIDGLVGLFGPPTMPMALRERIAADIKAVMDSDAIIKNRLIPTAQIPTRRAGRVRQVDRRAARSPRQVGEGARHAGEEVICAAGHRLSSSAAAASGGTHALRYSIVAAAAAALSSCASARRRPSAQLADPERAFPADARRRQRHRHRRAPSGGPADQKWGQSVVIENKPGGDGIVAINAFVGAKDDHVLLLSPTSSFIAHRICTTICRTGRRTWRRSRGVQHLRRHHRACRLAGKTINDWWRWCAPSPAN